MFKLKVAFSQQISFRDKEGKEHTFYKVYCLFKGKDGKEVAAFVQANGYYAPGAEITLGLRSEFSREANYNGRLGLYVVE